jgi:hypothetical protein
VIRRPGLVTGESDILLAGLAAVGPDRVCGFVGHFTAQGAEYESAEERNDHQGKQGESYGHHGCPFVAPILDADTMTNPE